MQESLDTTALKHRLTEMLGARVVDLSQMSGGRNSRSYRCTCKDGTCYAVKLYHPADERNHRLSVEWSSVEFLWQHGIRDIPRPLTSDAEEGLAIYEYIDGTKLDSREISRREVDQAIRFLVGLKKLSNHPDALYIPPAAEAFFTFQGIIDNIENRYRRLWSLHPETDIQRAMVDFLRNEFRPFFDQAVTWINSEPIRTASRIEDEIPLALRTLSPSDFGFHNAIRREDGRMVFLDFEYFGWDDPAKMIVDFILHPAQKIDDSLKSHFIKQMVHEFQDETLPYRLKMVYPLFGCKWVLILLNEFIPEHMRRRSFAGAQEKLSVSGLQEKQLHKAKKMMSTVTDTYGKFPYNE